MMKPNIKETFTKELPSDPNLENSRRQVTEAVFSYANPKKTKAPKVIYTSQEMATELGVSEEETNSEFFKNIVTGNEVYPNTKPYAMCYGGHQFGNWAGQLGDGRAINLFEIEHKNNNWKVQLKGAGETPYSRTADGLAVFYIFVLKNTGKKDFHISNIEIDKEIAYLSYNKETIKQNEESKIRVIFSNELIKKEKIKDLKLKLEVYLTKGEKRGFSNFANETIELTIE